ncbi:MAG TPA: hypothetical protein VFZ05_04265 [Nitrososphaera sp.]
MRGCKALVAVAISLLVTSACAIQPVYAAGSGHYVASFLGFFDYTMDVDASELFPSEQIKEEVITKGEPSQFTIAEIKRKIAGFTVSAQDVFMKLSPFKVDSSNTHIDVDIQGARVEISGIFTKTYNNVDVDGIYGIYNTAMDKVTIHVPYKVALSFLFS